MNFKISKDSIKERKRLLIIMAVSMPIMSVVFLLIFSIQGKGIKNVPIALTVLGIMSLLLVAEVFVVGKMMLKRVRSIQLHFDENGFTRINGPKEERFEFNNMTQIKISKNDDRSHKMIIQGKGDKKAFILAGFEGMDDLYGLFESSGISMIEKKQKIDWSNPKVMVITMLLTCLFLAAIIMMGGKLYNYVNQMIKLGFGLYILIFKPISKSAGARFKIMEYIVGGLLVILGTFMMVINILGL